MCTIFMPIYQLLYIHMLGITYISASVFQIYNYTFSNILLVSPSHLTGSDKAPLHPRIISTWSQSAWFPLMQRPQ